MHWHIIFGHHRANNAALIPHTRDAGLVLSDVMRRWALPSMAGVALGSGLTAIAPANNLKATFVVIACVIASKFLIGGERWVVGTELPDSAAMSGYGFVIGLASSLMGISAIAGDNGADAIRQAGPQRGSNRGRHRCADYASRHDRLCSGRPATSNPVATAFSRFRIGHRCRSDCADFEFGRALRCPLGTQSYRSENWKSASACSCCLSPYVSC